MLAAMVGMLFVVTTILSSQATDLKQGNAEKNVPTRQVKVYNHMLPEKNKWHISKGRKKLCEGGPYSQWYSSVRTDCTLPSGSYSITCCDLRSNEGWSGGYIQITGKKQKLCEKFSFDAKKKCYTEKFTVARIPTPRPTPKPTPPLETTFHECLKKSAKAITDSVPGYKLSHKDDGVKKDYIADGGNDMYDNGNRLYIKVATNEFHGPLKYNQLCNGQFANAGAGDVEYFTCKETTSNGDIFFAGFRSKNKYISGFSTGGNTGADNYDNVAYHSWIDGELKPFKHGRYGRWWAYRKSMAFSQTDYKPSINHLIFVPNKNWEHDWPRDNNQNRRRVWATDVRRRRAFTTDPDWHETRADGANNYVSHILYVMWGGLSTDRNGHNKVIRYDQTQIEKIISKVNMACQ